MRNLQDLYYKATLCSVTSKCTLEKRGQMSTSQKDTLHILAIFHYVIAGLAALVASIPLIHLALGLFLTVGGVSGKEPVLGIMGAAFSIVALLIILAGWGIAVLIFLAGKNLDRQTKYQLCMGGAAVLCIFLPFGTILGVFTIVTLQDDAVKLMFKNNESLVSGEADTGSEPL